MDVLFAVECAVEVVGECGVVDAFAYPDGEVVLVVVLVHVVPEVVFAAGLKEGREFVDVVEDDAVAGSEELGGGYVDEDRALFHVHERDGWSRGCRRKWRGAYIYLAVSAVDVGGTGVGSRRTRDGRECHGLGRGTLEGEGLNDERARCLGGPCGNRRDVLCLSRPSAIEPCAVENDDDDHTDKRPENQIGVSGRRYRSRIGGAGPRRL